MRRANLPTVFSSSKLLLLSFFGQSNLVLDERKRNSEPKHETQTEPTINGQTPVPHGEIVGLSNVSEFEKSDWLKKTHGVTFKKYRS